MKYCDKCGKPVNHGDKFCQYCGARLQNKDTTNKTNNSSGDKARWGWFFLGLIIPIIGIILYVIWLDETPNKAKKCLHGAITGAVIHGIIVIVSLVITFLVLGGVIVLNYIGLTTSEVLSLLVHF